MNGSIGGDDRMYRPIEIGYGGSPAPSSRLGYSVSIANFVLPGLPDVGVCRWESMRVGDVRGRNSWPYRYCVRWKAWTHVGNEEWSTNKYGGGGLIVHYVSASDREEN